MLEEPPGRVLAPDRAPQGWVADVRGRCRYDHPLQPPLGASGARSAVISSALQWDVLAGWVPV